MMRFALVIAVALAWVVGCSRDDGSVSAAEGPAGNVVAVTGMATATRDVDGEAPRALEVGSVVHADDVIETGPDGSVRIRLDHNRAVWELGSGERRRVDESLAWRAAETDDEDEDDDGDDGDDGDERSVAAGRHAEDESAETRATAAEEAAEAQVAEEAAAEPPPPPARKRARASARRKAEPAAPPPREAPPSAAPEMEIARRLAPTDAATRADEPTPSGIELQEQVVAAVRGHLHRCYDEVSSQRDEPLSGRVEVAVRVGRDGRVEDVEVEIERGDLAGVPECASRILRGVTLETYGRSLTARFTDIVRGR